MKIFNKIILLIRMKRSKPYDFHFIGENEGEPVGDELCVEHLTFHDMAPYACRCKLTEEKLRNGSEANAIRIIGFERTGDVCGITSFQPCKI